MVQPYWPGVATQGGGNIKRVDIFAAFIVGVRWVDAIRQNLLWVSIEDGCIGPWANENNRRENPDRLREVRFVV